MVLYNLSVIGKTGNFACHFNYEIGHMVGVAQLVRAPGCGPGGRGFNSHRSPKLIAGSISNSISAILLAVGSRIKNELSGTLNH